MMNKLAVGVIVLSLAVGASPFIADHFLVKNQGFSFEANATAVNNTANQTKRIGIVTNSNMRFGEVPVGMSVVKFMNVSMPKKGIFEVNSVGNISEMLDYQESQYFEGNREIRIEFNGTRPGYYNGSVDIKTQVPLNDIGQRWLDTKYSLLH
ncbi:MAG: hypothetical protein ACI8Z7_000152 [Candidatus Nanohaloarchaea archaeon]|jgi:hypothetical protein